ncbi:uncharacterized protein LOC131952366 [Physella acuta]|uniref:uncharacterized protein LOC131952366 n=1 Tax=Physella acuta TaxID=109671 RepID=UPI0027DDC648|nr:uncharacterized protein LOC131952366 [Physella acuta]
MATNGDDDEVKTRHASCQECLVLLTVRNHVHDSIKSIELALVELKNARDKGVCTANSSRTMNVDELVKLQGKLEKKVPRMFQWLMEHVKTHPPCSRTQADSGYCNSVEASQLTEAMGKLGVSELQQLPGESIPEHQGLIIIHDQRTPDAEC